MKKTLLKRSVYGLMILGLLGVTSVSAKALFHNNPDPQKPEAFNPYAPSAPVLGVLEWWPPYQRFHPDLLQRVMQNRDLRHKFGAPADENPAPTPARVYQKQYRGKASSAYALGKKVKRKIWRISAP